MGRQPTPRILSVSERIYRGLLNFSPAGYRKRYETATVQVFVQCCRDAYRQGGSIAVLGLWLPLFWEAALGILAEHVAPPRSSDLSFGLRRSATLAVGALSLFGLAQVALLRIIDPLPPFQAVARSHPGIGVAYSLIKGGAAVALLAVAAAGGIMLITALAQAVRARRRDLRAYLAGLGLVTALPLAVALGASRFPRPVVIAAVTQLALVGLGLLCLLAATILVGLVALHVRWGRRSVRLALGCMAAIAIAMGVSLAATVAWMLQLWVEAPEFAASQGLSPAGLLGDFGGSAGVALAIATMEAATGGTLSAAWSGLRWSPPPSEQR